MGDVDGWIGLALAPFSARGYDVRGSGELLFHPLRRRASRRRVAAHRISGLKAPQQSGIGLRTEGAKIRQLQLPQLAAPLLRQPNRSPGLVVGVAKRQPSLHQSVSEVGGGEKRAVECKRHLLRTQLETLGPLTGRDLETCIERMEHISRVRFEDLHGLPPITELVMGGRFVCAVAPRAGRWW